MATPEVYADLSAGAYKGDDFYEAQKIAEKHGYALDDELSDNDRHVYYDRYGKAVVAFRGTKLTNPSDLLTDIAIWGGFAPASNRYRQSNKTVQRAIDKYGKDNITLTGHSLGGHQGVYFGNKYKLKTVVYNPAVMGSDVRQSKADSYYMPNDWMLKKNNTDPDHRKHIQIHTTGVDPIAFLSTKTAGYDVRHTAPTHINVHSLDNFRPKHRGKKYAFIM